MVVWDIYNFSGKAEYNHEEFFNYKAKETGRFIDATLSYTFSERFPLFLSWSTILYGRDRDGLNGQNRYSTFAYMEYRVWSNGLWEVCPGIGAGFALSAGKDINGNYSSGNFYGNTAGIVHLSLETTYLLTAFKRNFPITALAMWNLQSNQGYLQISICLFSF